MLVIEQTKGHELTHWSQINWTHVEANVRQLQGRIYRATRANDFKKVKNLQKLMTRSMSAKLKAIRQVTQENRGKHTPGIDGVVCDTPETRMELVKDGLHLKGYRPKPVRRVYIPKADGRKRPLGIPTVKDRCIQALIKLALEPEWEQRFEANSYGFRPGRSTMDAIEAIHTNLSRRGCSEWILDADIAGCLEHHWSHQEIASIFRLSLEQVQVAVDYIRKHQEDVMDVHRHLEERNARGNPPEIQEKLAASHAKRTAWMHQRQAKTQEHNGAGSPAGR
jgi:uncharacterized protein YoaH (UPF0181 family)